MGNFNLSNMLIIILVLNVLMFWSGIAIEDINPLSTTVLLNYNESMISNYDMGGYVLNTNATNVENALPTLESSVNAETGNIFTDSISSIKNWFLDKTGLNYIFSFLSGPMNIIKHMNLPQEFVFGIGAIWYGLTLFLIVSFIIGRIGA